MLLGVSVRVEDALPGNLALGLERGAVHALTPFPAVVDALGELVVHHALEDVLLVVPVVEDVLVEGVEDGGADHEAVDGHPEAVGEGDEGEADDEGGEERRKKDDEGLGGEEVEEEPHCPDEEGVGGGAEVGEPVGNDGEDEGDEEEVGQADEEVGDEEGGGAVEAVVVLFDVLGAVFEEGGDVGDGHEGHEGAAEELQLVSRDRTWKKRSSKGTYDCVGQGNDGFLAGGEADPDRAHHDCKTWTCQRKIVVREKGSIPVYMANRIPYATTSR